MCKYLPTTNMVAIKNNINNTLNEYNLSSSKVAKAIGVTTSEFKNIRNISNENLEISPKQFVDLNKYLSNTVKVTIETGPKPDDFYQTFIIYLYKNGMEIEDFCKKFHTNKEEVKSWFGEKGLSYSRWKILRNIMPFSEFSKLTAYDTITLSNDRDEKTIEAVNRSTLIYYFMTKRGYTTKTLAAKTNYNSEYIDLALEGFITSSLMKDISKALEISESSLNKIILNSWDLDNNIGYFLQKTMHRKKYNVYTLSHKLNIKYEHLKGILSGTICATDEDVNKLAEEFNLDPWQLRLDLPKDIVGYDDKYIPWNFAKWVYSSDIPYPKLDSLLSRDTSSLIEKIKKDEGGYKMPSIDKLVSVTGLEPKDLRAPVTQEEIEDIKKLRRKSGRKNNFQDDSFEGFIRNKIDSLGLSFAEFSDIISINKSNLKYYIKNKKFKDEDLENLLKALDLTKDDIKKYKITKLKELKPRTKKIETTPIKEPDITDDKEKFKKELLKRSEEYEDQEYRIIRDMAKYIFNKLKDKPELKITSSDIDIINNDNLRDKVVDYINRILLLDNNMGDCRVFCVKRFAPVMGTYLKFSLLKPDDDLPNYISADNLQDIVDKDDSSLYPSSICEYDATDGTIIDKNRKTKEEINEDNKEFMMEELDAFLHIYSKLSEAEQCTVLRIMNTIKHPDDLEMKNIPEDCFLSNHFAYYKKTETIIKMTELEDK